MSKASANTGRPTAGHRLKLAGLRMGLPDWMMEELLLTEHPVSVHTDKDGAGNSGMGTSASELGLIRGRYTSRYSSIRPT